MMIKDVLNVMIIVIDVLKTNALNVKEEIFMVIYVIRNVHYIVQSIQY